MWQTAAVLLIVAGVLVYLVRHYARVFRGRAPACPSCSDCCAARPPVGDAQCECGPAKDPF